MTVYQLCEFLIERKRYTREDMLKKVNVFYANNQLADEEYTQLLTDMDAQKSQAQAKQYFKKTYKVIIFSLLKSIGYVDH